MVLSNIAGHLVAVVGAGPAGLNAARELAAHDVQVVMFNRDIKPGGMAEYGIYPNKYKMKHSLRVQFHQILTNQKIAYFGNVAVGNHTGFRLEDIRGLGFQAILVTSGAQATKWLGLPGEQLSGVMHAKDLVFYYNHLPPYNLHPPKIGRRVAVVGVGNVMMDIAHYLIEEVRVDEVIGIARRGPADIKFSLSEVEAVAANLDMHALEAELSRTEPIMQAVGQDVELARKFFHHAAEKALPSDSKTHLTIQFLASPVEILSDGRGGVGGLKIEANTLTKGDGETRARGLGRVSQLDVDTVIYAIGDSVDPELGLPMRGVEFCKSPAPRFPVENISYEACDPKKKVDVSNIFIAGWARKASSGLVGVARRDGFNAARAVLQYLESLPLVEQTSLEMIERHMQRLPNPVVSAEEITWLTSMEEANARRLNLPEFHYESNEEMLAVIRQKPG